MGALQLESHPDESEDLDSDKKRKVNWCHHQSRKGTLCITSQGSLGSSTVTVTEDLENRHNHNKPRNKDLELVRQRTVSVISQESFGSIAVVTTTTETDDIIKIDTHGIPPAPDGGWGWVVLPMTFLSFVTMGISFAGFSVLYVALVEEFKSERGVTGWIGSLLSFTGGFFGVVIGALIERFGCKTICMTGGLLMATGFALSAFLVNIPYLYITYGVVAGIGSGMVMSSSLVILQRYFNKRRTLAMGLGTTGLSCGAFISAPLDNLLLNKYGLSGTFLILSGIVLQNMVFGSLYRPVGRVKDMRKSGTDTSKTTQKSMDCSICSDILDCSPLKNIKFVLYLIGTFLMNIGCTAFFVHYFSRIIFLGMDRRMAITLQACMSGATGITRLCFSFIGNTPGLDRVLLYAVAITVGGVIVVSLPLAQTTATIACYGIARGITSGAFFTFQHSVTVDIAGVSQIAKLTGFLNLSISVAILTAIPLAGFIFDVSQDYDLPFYVAGSIQLLGGGVLLTLAALHRNNKCVHKDKADQCTGRKD